MNTYMTRDPFRTAVFCICLLVLSVLLYGFHIPLLGVHEWRQSDTLYSAEYMSKNGLSLLGHINFGGALTGTETGEFPFYQWVLALWGTVFGFSPQSVHLFQWLIAIALTMSSLQFLRSRQGLKLQAAEWVALFVFMPASLRFLTINIPDAMALLLMVLSGLLWPNSLRKTEVPKLLIAMSLFILGFAVRPYYAPLLLVFAAKWRSAIICLIGCFGVYLSWYKGFAPRHSEIGYYYTGIGNLAENLKIAPQITLRALYGVFWDHLNFIGLLFLATAIRSSLKGGSARTFLRSFMGRNLIAALGALVLLIFLRGQHFITHRYYMLGIGLSMAFVMAEGYSKILSIKKKWLLVLMMILGVSGVYHLWLPQKHEWKISLREQAQKLIQPHEKVVVYHYFSPAWLYYINRTGWSGFYDPARFPNSCPTGASWALVIPKEPEFRFEKCEVFYDHPHGKLVDYGS